MKRFLACLAVLVVASLAITGSLAHGASAQEMLYNYMPVQDDGCEVAASFGHAVAFAENGTFTQSSTGPNCSPRSGFPTVSIGGSIPAPTYEGQNNEFRRTPVIGKPCKSGAKLYVLRV